MMEYWNVEVPNPVNTVNAVNMVNTVNYVPPATMGIMGVMAMKKKPIAFAAGLLAMVAAGMPGVVAGEPMPLSREGAQVVLDGKTVAVKKWDVPPYVESEYTKVFRFDRFDNPKLKQLREQEQLDEVVAPGKDEFGKQVLLLDWAFRRIKKFGTPTAKPQGALEIIRDVDAGHTFYCVHYANLLVSAGASLGWVVRPLGLRRPDSRGSGSTSHTLTEIWSNQHRQWVMFDPQYALYCEKEGTPLNAWEIRQEWYCHGDGKDLTFVIGAEQKRHTVKDLPINLGNFSLRPNTFHKYAFLSYIPNTDLMDAGPDYEKMFISKDAICEGTKYHTRKNPADPAVEPYFPIHQAALELAPAQGSTLNVKIRTLTPNFKTFLVKIDAGDWRPSAETLSWPLHPGENTLVAKSVNRFGVEGPVSTVMLEMQP